MRVLAAALASCLMLAGCSGGSGASTQITVMAASSLTVPFDELAKQFEQAHPGVDVVTSYGASSTLATQIINGAPADVFASASQTNMDQVTSADLAANPALFASNVMAIAVPAGNPAGIQSLSDLQRPGVKVAICQPAVPCGVAAQQLFEKNKLTITPVTAEPDVRSVLTKVSQKDVDAGIVYRSDVTTAPDSAQGIQIPATNNVSTTYPIVTLSRSSQSATAGQFVEFVLSPAGQSVLQSDGFNPAP